MKLRLSILVLAVLALPATVAATPPPASLAVQSAGRVGPMNSVTASAGAALPDTITGTHFMYAADGTATDGIDVFKLTGSTVTFVQHVAATAGSAGGYFGAHRLAVAGANTTHGNCLVFSGGSAANVLSYSINATTGALTGPVTNLPLSGTPSDVQVAGNKNSLYLSNPGASSIDVVKVNAGCTLSLVHRNSTGTEVDINIRLLDTTTLVSADNTTGNIVFYQIGAAGALAEFSSKPGQIAGPDSVDILKATTPWGAVANVYTGQAISGQPHAQGFQTSGGNISGLLGSPQTLGDAGASNGASIFVDSADSALLQAAVYTGQIGFYSITAGSPGHPGALDYVGDATTPGGGLYLMMITMLQKTAFGIHDNGKVDACTVSKLGISGCATIATLTGAGSGTATALAFL